MKNKAYYIIGIVLIVVAAVAGAIFLTSSKEGNIIDITSPSKTQAFRRVSKVALSPGTAQNLYFHKKGWFINKIEFRMPDFSNTDFQLKARVIIKGKKPIEEDWTSLGKKVFCLDRKDERVKDVVLTIINNSPISILSGDIQTFAMRDGCNEWSGSLSYQWFDTSEKVNEQGVLQSIFTLKENLYGTEFVATDGGYNYNLLGCSRENPVKTYSLISDGELSQSSLRLVPLDDGSYDLKIPAVWGKTDKAKEYIKKNKTCIYGKESGDVVNELEESQVRTLNEVMAENFILTPDALTGNMKGSKEIEVNLDGGVKRKIKLEWSFIRQ